MIDYPSPATLDAVCFADQPYALAADEELQRRRNLMVLPHMQPLEEYLTRVRSSLGAAFKTPQFDPCDGGVNAKVLILLEAPGPQAVGSRFVSRNNPDPTARNLCDLLATANLPRQSTVIWNVVPYYVGTGDKIRAVNAHDLQLSGPFLKELLELLPELRVVVLMGKKAQRMKSALTSWSEVPIMKTHHPSARVFNVWPEKRIEVAAVLNAAAKLVG